MKKWLVALVVILIIIFGFLAGKYIYKMTTIKEDSNFEIADKQKIEDECTLEYERLKEIKQTNANEEKVSPNARLITNIYYNECGHTVKSASNIEAKYINLLEEDFAKEYNDWEVKEFSSEEIVLYKENPGICNEHYVVKEKDGYVAVYSLDNNEKETLEDITEISVSFLPTTDVAKLQGGIKVYGRENLNSVLEDFE